MKRIRILATAVLTLSVSLAMDTIAHAHHSFSAEFDGSKAVRIVGTLSRIEWTNPHSYFYLQVLDGNGHVTTWACEGGGPGALSRRGFKRGDIKLGDTLVIDGYRAKDASHFIDARRVTLPDGRTVYGGSPGDGGPGDNLGTVSAGPGGPGSP